MLFRSLKIERAPWRFLGVSDMLRLGRSAAATTVLFVLLNLTLRLSIAGGARTPGGDPYDDQTLQLVFSTTKGATAICVGMCVERGLLDLQAPVATYWPEFATNGKEGVLVRHVMGHTAGLPGWDPAITMQDQYDWDPASKVLAEQAPWWEPGSASGYHAITQGYLIGEVVRRITGKSLGTVFREEIAEPLDADFHIGLPASEDGRVADLVPPPPGAAERGNCGPHHIPGRCRLAAVVPLRRRGGGPTRPCRRPRRQRPAFRQDRRPECLPADSRGHRRAELRGQFQMDHQQGR